MALRFTVQGEDENETAEGLRLLLAAGLDLAMPPRQMVGNGWLARAVPSPTAKAPTVDDGRGLGVAG
jgi:hypothetical protein